MGRISIDSFARIISTIFIQFIKIILSIWTNHIDGKYKINHHNIIKFKGVFPPKYTLSTEIFVNILSLIKKILLKYSFSFNILELGIGTGVLAKILSSSYTYIIGVDTLYKACLNTSYNDPDKSIDLICGFSTVFIRGDSIDIAYTNPPYLPCEAKVQSEYSICGGNYLQIILKIIIDLLRIVHKHGLILFTLSSFSKPDSIFWKNIRNLGEYRILTKLKFIGFEEIKIYLLKSVS